MRSIWNYGKYILLALSLGVIIFVGARSFGGSFSVLPDAPSSAGVQVANAYSEPSRLKIPSINVDAKIIPVGVDKNGNMDVAHNQYDVAWYQLGARPGMPGTAALAGHLDTKLTPEAVFYNVDKLKPGDEVDVTDADGQEIKFKVSDIKTYPYDATMPEVFTPTGPSRISLITCTGTWLPDKKVYDKRLVVFADKVD